LRVKGKNLYHYHIIDCFIVVGENPEPIMYINGVAA